MPAAVARTEMARLAKRQRDLLIFVTAMTDVLSTEAQELAIYVFFVVERMFRQAGALRRVKRREIVAAFERNQDAFAALENAHARFLERAATSAAAAEPHVMAYVVSALFEEDEERDVTLSEAESGEIFLYLKTVVDVLHAASSA